MMATFMPMKAILILAAGEVPGFFPEFLVERGAFLSSLVLLIGAAVFGLVSWSIGAGISQLDSPYLSVGRVGVNPSARPRVRFQEQMEERNTEASMILVLPIIAVLALVSLTYVAVTLVWLVANAAWVVWMVRRSPRIAPYSSGADQFSHRLRKWLKDSAIWSVVGISLITLLLEPPALGSTAILIAAIFGRRLTVLLADLVPRATVLAAQKSSLSKTTLASLVTNIPTARTENRPIEYFSTPPGARLLEEFFERRGYPRRNFQVVGSGFPGALSLLCGPDEDVQLLVRVFPLQREVNRNHELIRRNEPGGGGIFPELLCSATSVAGFPAIEARLDSPRQRMNLGVKPGRQDAVGFQIERELGSLASFPGQSYSLPGDIEEDKLIDALKRAMRLPGSHLAPCQRLLQVVPETLNRIATLPAALIPQSPVHEKDLYFSSTGEIRYLGGEAWGVGRVGDSWRATPLYAKTLKTYLAGQEPTAPLDVDAVLLNTEMRALMDALSRFQLSDVSARARALGKRISRP